jgi:hypothetical protein
VTVLSASSAVPEDQEEERVFAVIYRWRLHTGAEESFVDGWTRVTRAIDAECGSYGSRLHQAEDGTWVAYARWPDAATRERCQHTEIEGERLMSQAVAKRFETLTMDIVIDLLREPADARRP